MSFLFIGRCSFLLFNRFLQNCRYKLEAHSHMSQLVPIIIGYRHVSLEIDE